MHAMIPWSGITLLGCAAVTSAAHDRELEVCARGCDYVTVQSAVDSARSGDTIKIGSGTFFENVLIDRKSLILVGAGEDKTTIDGRFRGPVFTIGIRVEDEDTSKSVTLVGMTITHGRGRFGGGITVNAEELDIQYCIVASNFATENGGGIAIPSDMLAKITHTVITHNRAPIGGGIEADSESGVLMTDSTVAHNTADLGGGGLALVYKAFVTIKDTTVSDNASRGDGGGVLISDGEPSPELTLTNSAIVENTAVGSGGGIYDHGHIIGDHSVIARNKAGRRGGGIRAVIDTLHKAEIYLNDVFVIQNSAGIEGGGILSEQILNLTNSTIQDNHPDNCSAVSGCP